MPASQELTRRHLLKTAAGVAVAPFLQDGGLIAAQENDPMSVQKTCFEVPNTNTLEDHFRAFSLLVGENMRPEGLDLLGITPLLDDERELKSQYDSGVFATREKFISEKQRAELSFPFNKYNTIVGYDLLSPEGAAHFRASYLYHDGNPTELMHIIAFVIDDEGKLGGDDNTFIPQDMLPAFGEIYFDLRDPLYLNDPPSWVRTWVPTDAPVEEAKGVTKWVDGYYENGAQYRQYSVNLKRGGNVVFEDRITKLQRTP